LLGVELLGLRSGRAALLRSQVRCADETAVWHVLVDEVNVAEAVGAGEDVTAHASAAETSTHGDDPTVTHFFEHRL